MARRFLTRQGFTLIELSIVLVIIGLLIGGVLVGRDMIEAAEARSVVTQVESYRTALNTFRIKYNDLPGDISGTAASEFVTRAGTQAQGDQDGLIEGCTTTSARDYAGCENVLMWRDLTTAKLIDSAFTTGIDGALVSIVAEQIHLYFPRLKAMPDLTLFLISKNNTVTIAPYEVGYIGNFFVVAAITSIQNDSDIRYSVTQGMGLQTAYAIDSKIDDGKPLTGNTQGITSGGGVYNLSLTNPNCIMQGATLNVYSRSTNDRVCNMMFSY